MSQQLSLRTGKSSQKYLGEYSCTSGSVESVELTSWTPWVQANSITCFFLIADCPWPRHFKILAISTSENNGIHEYVSRRRDMTSTMLNRGIKSTVQRNYDGINMIPYRSEKVRFLLTASLFC